ncbi:MAG: hypothetical protein GF329_15820 [Candidatus Lokiarchaeota archaeon]|nr:hypothetical protein [Candidatus Lokiarchaeota archaeon]
MDDQERNFLIQQLTGTIIYWKHLTPRVWSHLRPLLDHVKEMRIDETNTRLEVLIHIHDKFWIGYSNKLFQNWKTSSRPEKKVFLSELSRWFYIVGKNLKRHNFKFYPIIKSWQDAYNFYPSHPYIKCYMATDDLDILESIENPEEKINKILEIVKNKTQGHFS